MQPNYSLFRLCRQLAFFGNLWYNNYALSAMPPGRWGRGRLYHNNIQKGGKIWLPFPL